MPISNVEVFIILEVLVFRFVVCCIFSFYLRAVFG